MPDINGTSGNDTLIGTSDADTINSLLGRDNVDGLGGSDTLIVDYSSAAVDPYAGASIANVPSVVLSTGGAFQGAIKTVDGGNSVTFSNIEHLQVTLDFFHNIFRLDGSALAQGASIWVNGFAGIDTLDLDLSALASVDLQVGPGGITASFGTFFSFEIFELDLTEAADNVTTGSDNDTLNGNGGDDVLNGAGGRDVLSGGTGTNSLTGGDGDDRIISAGIDTVNGGDGHDRWTGTYGSSSEDLIFVHNSATGTGTLSNGTTLSSVEGVEALTTGSGNDVLTFTSTGGILVSTGAGEDMLTLTGNGWSGTIQADGSAAFRGTLGYAQISGVEHLNFTSLDFDDSIAVVAAPFLAGATLSLDAAGGHDTLAMDFTGFGGISFVVSGGTVTTSVAATLSNFESYHIVSGAGADTITTGDGDDIVEGKGGADVIRTAGGNDQLDGGGGADRMLGGLGDDLYIVQDALDQVVEVNGAGFDLVQSSVTHVLAVNVENLILTGAAAIDGTGNSQANTLIGNAAANVLNGGGAADTMAGGLGNDTYVVDNAGDLISEAAGAGIDMVQTSTTHTLAANVENLTLTGLGAINGTGNALANAITGNAAANTLDGGGANDTMTGGLGNDTYVVDHALDQVVEAASGGNDRVASAVNYTLGNNVEALFLSGTGAINGTGNALANALTGNSAANTLDGGAGNDTMTGGAGNDTYVVDHALDQVIEAAGGGTDRVASAVSYTLGNDVEHLFLSGTAAINGTGNALANSLTGNSAANLLNGGAANDTMTGREGDDTYVVDHVLDKVVEAAAGGTDLVSSSVSFKLGNHVENLTLTGAAAVDATGNSLANILTGNSAANILNGAGGADTMRGGAGNDTYYVDQAGDAVIETNASHGIDLVKSAVSFTLGANLENLTLVGTAAVGATGNTLANVLVGNSAANSLAGAGGHDTLSGANGADTLNGNAGLDTLTGGAHADRFVFDSALNASTNLDHITDFIHGSDKIVLDNAVFTGLAAGALPAGAFVVGSAAADANDRIIYNAATGALSFDSDGTGAAAAIQFATLDNLPANLSASDFLVI